MISGKLIAKDSFAGNFTVLMTGTVIAQAIPFLLAPLLTRLYSPETFGLLGLFSTILNTMSTLSTGRYEQAIILPESKEEAANVARLTMFTSFLFSILTLLVVLVFGHLICKWINSDSFYLWLLFIPLSVFMASVQQAYTFWFIREKQYSYTSVNKVVQTSSNVLISVSLGLTKFSLGILGGEVIGRVIAAISGVYFMTKKGFGLFACSMKGMREAARRFSDFPKYNVIPFTLSTFCASIPIILIARHFDTHTAGLFNLSRQAIFIPLALIGSSMSQIFLQKFRTLFFEKKQIMPIVRNVAVKMFLVCLVMVVCMAIFGSQVFGFVFGEQWEISGTFGSVLIFTYSIQFFVSPFSVLFVSLEKIKWYSLWQILYFVAMLFLFVLDNLSISQFILIYTSLEFTLFVFNILLIFIIVKKHDKGIIQHS